MSRYAALHKSPHGPGDGRPTALSIIMDENLINGLPDKVVLVTGTSSGIGVDTVRALAATGAHVFCGVRSLSKGQEALSDILESDRVELIELDLNALNNVRDAVAAFLSRSKSLNILVCNAGNHPPTTRLETVDGFESQFGINHLAHFLLFQLLKPTLLVSSTNDFNSRVITLTSSGHKLSGLHYPDYNCTQSAYDPATAYSSSKTANIYMASEISRRYSSLGLHGLSVHPGAIFTKAHDVDPAMMAYYNANPAFRDQVKDSAQGAATTVYAALGKEWEGRGGLYLEDCAESVGDGKTGLAGMVTSGYCEWTFDIEKEGALWRDSCAMVGAEGDYV
ncbi:hypothetical protein MMC21_007846 [Puttea exsequens]|nr:hypothetical protein [Puttea exsequens]